MKRTMILILALISLTACSHHWRQANFDVNRDEVLNRLDSLTNGSVASNNVEDADIQSFKNLRNTEGARIFYAQGPSQEMGPVESLLSVDLSQLNLKDVDPANVNDAQLFFIDAGSVGSGPSVGLLVAVRQNGSDAYTIRTFFGNAASHSAGEYVAALGKDKDNPSMILTSIDADQDGNLDEVIQFRITDASGGNIGQFSTLVSL